MGYPERSYDLEHEDDRHWKRRRFSPPAEQPVTLRLIAKASSRSPLPPDRYLALLDPSTTVSIGRDRAFDARLRLKELAVSKTHATLFWLPGKGEPASWAIVDCGSQHGTFVQRKDSEEWERISEPRVASKPWRVQHLDRIKICSTTFTAHIHQPPCDACAIASDNSNLIPLVAEPEGAKDVESTQRVNPAVTKAERQEATKQDLKSLKAQLLSKPDRPGRLVEAPTVEYVDRAKLRRERERAGSSTASIKNVPLPQKSVATANKPVTASLEESKGYAMLSKLSGPLGSSADMAQPIKAKTLGDTKAGLGSRDAMDESAFAAQRGAGGHHEQRRARWDEFKNR